MMKYVLIRLICKWDRLERRAVRLSMPLDAKAAMEAKDKYLEILQRLGA